MTQSDGGSVYIDNHGVFRFNRAFSDGSGDNHVKFSGVGRVGGGSRSVSVGDCEALVVGPCVGQFASVFCGGVDAEFSGRRSRSGAECLVRHRSKGDFRVVHCDNHGIFCFGNADVVAFANGGGDGQIVSGGGIGFDGDFCGRFFHVFPSVGQFAFIVAVYVGRQCCTISVADGLVQHRGEGDTRIVHVHHNGIVSGDGAVSDSSGDNNRISSGIGECVRRYVNVVLV